MFSEEPIATGFHRMYCGGSQRPYSCYLKKSVTNAKFYCCWLTLKDSQPFSFKSCHLKLDGSKSSIAWSQHVMCPLSLVLKDQLLRVQLDQSRSISWDSIPRMMPAYSVYWPVPHQKEKRYYFLCLISLQSPILKLNFWNFVGVANFD